MLTASVLCFSNAVQCRGGDDVLQPGSAERQDGWSGTRVPKPATRSGQARPRSRSGGQEGGIISDAGLWIWMLEVIRRIPGIKSLEQRQAPGKDRVRVCRKGGRQAGKRLEAHKLGYCRLLLLTADPGLSGDVDSCYCRGSSLGDDG